MADKDDTTKVEETTPETTATETPTTEVTATEDQKPDTTTIETKTKEVKPEAPEPEIDVSAIEAEVTKKVSEKIIQSLTGGSEADVTKATGEQSPWAKEGRNPRDYDEIAEWTTQLALKKQEEAAAKQEEAAKAKEEDNKKVQEERAKAFNKYWDDQLNELAEGGKLPPIEDAKDENDIGVRARKQLFTKMIEVNEERTKAGKEPIYSLKEIFYEHPINEEPGMFAPVSIGRGSVPAEGDEYEYVGKKSFFDIITGK